MEPIFNVPVGADQGQYPLRWCLAQRETAESIDDLLANLPGFEDGSGALEAKDLLNPLPCFGKPVVEIRTTENLPMLG